MKDVSDLAKRIEGTEYDKTQYVIESIQCGADDRYIITVKVNKEEKND